MNRTVSITGYLALWVFALALALMEAAVVIYLRALSGNALFPLNDALHLLGPKLRQLEMWREVATLFVLFVPVMLLQVSALVRVAAFAFAFALWDLAYYAFLWLLIDWPKGWMAYDILFLIPKPWIAPVLCPILVAATIALGSTAYLSLARNRVARIPGVLQSLGIAIGALCMLIAFMWETDYYLKGGLPPKFHWWLFIVGYGVAVAG